MKIVLGRGGLESSIYSEVLLVGIEGSYTWIQIKKLLQEQVCLRCEKFGTWSSSGKRIDRVPNRKVLLELKESSVLGPQKRSMSRLSPEQESTTEEVPNSFSAWYLKETGERVDRALNRKALRRNCSEQQAPLSPLAQQPQPEPHCSQWYFQCACCITIYPTRYLYQPMCTVFL